MTMNSNMNLYMPEIFWHDRKGILSVDIQRQCLSRDERRKYGYDDAASNGQFGSYKIATASVQREIRIWEFHFDRQKDDNHGNEVYRLSVNFIANLEGHESPTNTVRFSPNGKFLASGDVQGGLIVWKISSRDEESALMEKERTSDDFPPNRENWVRAFRVPIRHFGDVTGICWSPDSTAIASVSTDDSISLHKADSGKPIWTIRNFRHFANGIAWDPRGKYIVTLSTDRRFDIIEAAKGTRLRMCHRVELPTFVIGVNETVGQEYYKIFHDDQLISFLRGVEFSPCGSLVFAPAGHLEVRDHNVYGSFVFKRCDFDKCRPYAMIPSSKPTFMVKCSPIFYELRKDVKENYMRLPYRIIFAVLCKESILFYDTQFSKFFAYADEFQFDHLTNLAWTPDGKVLVVSSLEGYNSFFTFTDDMLGEPCAEQDCEKLIQSRMPVEKKKPIEQISANDENQPPKPFEYPDSPRLIQPKKSHRKKEATADATAVVGPTTVSGSIDTVLVSSALADGTVSTSDFTIVKRKVSASSPVRSAKRKKEADGTPSILTNQSAAESATPKNDGTPKPSVVQKKISDLW